MEGWKQPRHGSKNFEKLEHRYEQGPRGLILSPPSPEKCEQQLVLEFEDEGASPSHWIDLPGEVMDIILSHLGSDDIQIARLVCKEWNWAISYTITSLKPRTLDLVEQGIHTAFPNIHGIDLKRCASILSDESLSKGLVQMRNLEKLNLEGAENITDTCVHMLCSLEKLRWLSLQRCVKITDQGILTLCGRVGKQTRPPLLLEYLDLSGIPLLTEISTCAVSEHLTSLRELRLGGYSRTVSVGDEMLQPLTVCQSLHSLDISGCITVRNLSILAHLRDLRYLNLWNCMRLNSSSLSCLSSMKLGLVELSLRGCHGIDDDIFPYIATLRCLKTLDLRSCEQIRGTQVDHLSQIPQLRNLNMRGCCGLVDLTGMGMLESLHALDLSECWQLSNESLKHLHSLTNLKDLKLHGCRNIVNAAGLGIQGLSGMKCLKILSLKNCEGLQQGALSSLSALQELRTLDISGCSKILSEDLRHIVHVKLRRLVASHMSWTGCSALQFLNESLEDLILSSCPNLVGTSFAPLKRLRCLKSLVLNGCSNTPLFDRGLQSLGASITTLSLQHCSTISDSGLASLSNLHNLEFIDLSDCCEITGDGFQQWSHMPRLHTVVLSGCPAMKDDGIFHLTSQNPSIVALNLKQCRRISDKAVMYIASYLPKIKALSFQASMGITDRGIRTIAREMRDSLTHLSVQFCWQFGDDSAVELASMPWLKHVDFLFSWKITDATLEAFAASTSLVDINIFGCHRVSSTAKEAIASKLRRGRYGAGFCWVQCRKSLFLGGTFPIRCGLLGDLNAPLSTFLGIAASIVGRVSIMSLDQEMEDSMAVAPSDMQTDNVWGRLINAGRDSGTPARPDSRVEDTLRRMQEVTRQYLVHSDVEEPFTRRMWGYDVEQGRSDWNGQSPQYSRMREHAVGSYRSLLYHGRPVVSAHSAGISLRNSTWNDFAKHQKHVGSSIQIKHWQLRDLVRCPFERDDVFVVKGFAIYRYDISRQNVVDRHGFLFEPTCFGFGDSFLGVAGEVSEYAVQHVSPALRSIGLPVENSIQHYGSLQTGGHVNNAIKITEDLDGRLSAFLCNNSGHLMVMTGIDQHGELQISDSSSIYCPVSINHCAVSEKERTLVYVGDSEEVFVCRPSPTGYRQCCSFREAMDAGMSCDWNTTGTAFAVASQDGLVCVWDRRQKRPVARMTTPSAARCVKFSPNPLDLLAFTEHRNYLHLVDCRMWENRQVIKVRDDVHEDVDICGFDFSPCGSRLYVGTEDSIDILEINKESRTSFPYSKLA